MGYHVRIVSKNNGFTRSDFDEIKARLTAQYGFREQLTDTGELDYLFHDAHESALIFFTPQLGFWAKNPDEYLLSLLIEAAAGLGGRYHVVGAEDEIYLAIDHVVTAENPAKTNKIKELLTDFWHNNLILLIVVALLTLIRHIFKQI